MEITCEAFNVQDQFKSWRYEDVVEHYRRIALPFAVASINVQGDLNIGNIIRTACVFAARDFFILGRRRFDRRSTVGATNYIPFTAGPEELTVENLNFFLNERGYRPVFIEQGGANINRFNWNDDLLPCLIMGAENGGVPAELISPNDPVYSIEQYGVMRCLNVSSAAAIAISVVASRFNETGK